MSVRQLDQQHGQKLETSAGAPRLLAIAGPTASGKTDVAMSLCAELPRAGEIISCDSVQVYRDFEIGCAKPSQDERARVAHHLIDVVDWSESFDAERYRQLAETAAEEIRSRQHRPILCGGTGLYLRAFRYGLMPLPSAPVELRASLAAAEAAEPGISYRRLQALDPVGAQRIEPRNLVRVQRALEICILTGRPPSELQEEHGFGVERVPMFLVALRWDDFALKRRIDQRAKAMVAAGLVEEVEDLLRRGVDVQARPMQSVGYREACEALAGTIARRELAFRIAQSTWQYARRQRTWLRRERDVIWIDVTSVGQAIAAVTELAAANELL